MWIYVLFLYSNESTAPKKHREIVILDCTSKLWILGFQHGCQLSISIYVAPLCMCWCMCLSTCVCVCVCRVQDIQMEEREEWDDKAILVSAEVVWLPLVVDFQPRRCWPEMNRLVFKSVDFSISGVSWWQWGDVKEVESAECWKEG